MQASIEEIAQLYGNPTFLQVFTNDVDRAAELKRRLRASKSDDEIEKDLRSLQGKRAELEDDIALKERESARLARKAGGPKGAPRRRRKRSGTGPKAVEDTTKIIQPMNEQFNGRAQRPAGSRGGGGPRKAP